MYYIYSYIWSPPSSSPIRCLRLQSYHLLSITIIHCLLFFIISPINYNISITYYYIIYDHLNHHRHHHHQLLDVWSCSLVIYLIIHYPLLFTIRLSVLSPIRCLRLQSGSRWSRLWTGAGAAGVWCCRYYHYHMHRLNEKV